MRQKKKTKAEKGPQAPIEDQIVAYISEGGWSHRCYPRGGSTGKIGWEALIFLGRSGFIGATRRGLRPFVGGLKSRRTHYSPAEPGNFGKGANTGGEKKIRTQGDYAERESFLCQFQGDLGIGRNESRVRGKRYEKFCYFLFGTELFCSPPGGREGLLLFGLFCGGGGDEPGGGVEGSEGKLFRTEWCGQFGPVWRKGHGDLSLIPQGR